MNAVEPPLGPPDASVTPRYAGIATFARLPRLEEVRRADIAVVGVPFDSGVSYRPGARFGPSHIREASRLLRPYNPEQDVEPFAAQQIVDAGDISANPFDLAEAVEQIGAAAAELSADGKRLLTLGGDHTIALPLLRSVARRHGPVAVLHFDAHLDTWDTYFGAPVTHGTPFRRASEEGLIDLSASTHVGIRGPLYSRQDLRDDERLGFAVISSPEIESEGLPRAIERMLARLGDRPVYLSVDIDVLDPAHAPGTGTPEAGGMTSRELLAMIRTLRSVNLVGADIVEVAPAYDHAQVTAVAAAHTAYEILSAMRPHPPATPR
ncbi:agmatinase [Streptomyces sp. TP-A0874]|uniref:agmatinase n=1 Tax=Streptomyces sp. TP-A0874 TaxID=549819 RepID=UPI0008531997|nr:agmatinase [Streptomyces sp. TP-A0874]